MSQYVPLTSPPSVDTAETQPNVAFQHPSSQLQDGNQSAFIIVNETPARQTFPLSFEVSKVLTLSIVKILIGALQICIGITNFFFIVSYTSTVLAFPIWCGIFFIVNGIIGVIIKCHKSQCAIGTFLGLSITSLFFSSVMLIYNGFVIHEVDDKDYGQYLNEKCYNYRTDGGYNSACSYGDPTMFPKELVKTSVGIHAALMVLIILELVCSIFAVNYSCKAYSKFCNTSDCDDCGTCVGCGECSMTSLQYQELVQTVPIVPQYQMHQFQQQPQYHQQQQQFIQSSQANQTLQQQQHQLQQQQRQSNQQAQAHQIFQQQHHHQQQRQPNQQLQTNQIFQQQQQQCYQQQQQQPNQQMQGNKIFQQQQQQHYQPQQQLVQPSQANQIFQQQQQLHQSLHDNAQQYTNPCSGPITIIPNSGGISNPLASGGHNPEDPHRIQVNLNSEEQPSERASDNTTALAAASGAMAGPLIRTEQNSHGQDLLRKDNAAFQQA